MILHTCTHYHFQIHIIRLKISDPQMTHKVTADLITQDGTYPGRDELDRFSCVQYARSFTQRHNLTVLLLFL